MRKGYQRRLTIYLPTHNYAAVLNISMKNIYGYILVMKWGASKLSIKLELDFDLYEINPCTTNKINTIFNQAVKAYSEVLATFTETEIYYRNKHMTGYSRNSNKVIGFDMSIPHTQMTNVWLPSTVFEVNVNDFIVRLQKPCISLGISLESGARLMVYSIQCKNTPSLTDSALLEVLNAYCTVDVRRHVDYMEVTSTSPPYCEWQV